MPVQQQMSSFAKKMGQRVAQANQEHKDKPIDAGMQKLPPGIRNGIAKVSSAYTKEYSDDKNGPGTKGQTFFRASAVVISPNEHNGEKTSGAVTSVIVPLCDMPAKGQRKAKSFSENWYEFQNLFKLLGISPPAETPQTDPTGQKTEAYYFAAMKTLCDPKRPVYISFSTRGWTPPPNPAQPKPSEMVFEEWHGLAEYNGQHDPASKVMEQPQTVQPEPMSQPPTAQTIPPVTQVEPQDAADEADIIGALVEVALNDPEGKTEEGAAASARLEELAWAAGATKDQTSKAADWAEVGQMALGDIPQAAASTQPNQSVPTVGSKWKFAKRGKGGGKLKNAKGEEFPPQAVEVTEVSTDTKTCKVKSVKDGKTIFDLRTKEPVQVQFDWLEPA